MFKQMFGNSDTAANFKHQLDSTACSEPNPPLKQEIFSGLSGCCSPTEKHSIRDCAGKRELSDVETTNPESCLETGSRCKRKRFSNTAAKSNFSTEAESINIAGTTGTGSQNTTEDEGGDSMVTSEHKFRRQRRKRTELNRTFTCSYEGCDRKYASNHALTLHQRKKHENGGVFSTMRSAPAQQQQQQQQKQQQKWPQINQQLQQMQQIHQMQQIQKVQQMQGLQGAQTRNSSQQQTQFLHPTQASRGTQQGQLQQRSQQHSAMATEVQALEISNASTLPASANENTAISSDRDLGQENTQRRSDSDDRSRSHSSNTQSMLRTVSEHNSNVPHESRNFILQVSNFNTQTNHQVTPQVTPQSTRSAPLGGDTTQTNIAVGPDNRQQSIAQAAYRAPNKLQQQLQSLQRMSSTGSQHQISRRTGFNTMQHPHSFRPDHPTNLRHQQGEQLQQEQGFKNMRPVAVGDSQQQLAYEPANVRSLNQAGEQHQKFPFTPTQLTFAEHHSFPSDKTYPENRSHSGQGGRGQAEYQSRWQVSQLALHLMQQQQTQQQQSQRGSYNGSGDDGEIVAIARRLSQQIGNSNDSNKNGLVRSSSLTDYSNLYNTSSCDALSRTSTLANNSSFANTSAAKYTQTKSNMIMGLERMGYSTKANANVDSNKHGNKDDGEMQPGWTCVQTSLASVDSERSLRTISGEQTCSENSPTIEARTATALRDVRVFAPVSQICGPSTQQNPPNEMENNMSFQLERQRSFSLDSQLQGYHHRGNMATPFC